MRAHFVGGTIPTFAAKSELRLDLTHGETLRCVSRSATLLIPYNTITTLEYGQRVGRRYASGILVSPVLLLAKTRKHFVTVGYADANGNQQAVVFQVHKDDIRATLAALEAKSGRRVEYQDDEARKSGGG